MIAPNPFDDTVEQPSNVEGTPADFLSSVAPPTQEAPESGIPSDVQSPESIGGLYYHDPNAVDDPNQIGKYITNVSYFGGREDYRSGQDNGRYAFGGGSYDPKSDMESTIPVVAMPEQWYDKGIVQPGQQFYVYNPSDPKRRVMVTAAEKGPADWVQKKRGVGLDLYAQDDIKQYLGVQSGERIGMDLTSVLRGTAPVLGQPPRPGTSYDEQAGNQIRSEMGKHIAEHPESLLAGPVTADSVNQAIEKGPVSQNSDGSMNYGNGLTVFPETGIVQIEASGQVYQWNRATNKWTHATVHAAPQTPELVKETREAQKPLVNEDGTAKSNLQLQKQLDEYYKENNLQSPAVRKEAENIVKMQMSSRNPWSKQYLAIAPNYETIVDIANKPGRTGADDIAMLQAIANIEAPGRSSTGHDMHQWAAARGLAGQLHVTKERYGALFNFLTGKMSQDDWEKGGHTLPDEMIPQLKRVADRAMESRYRQYMLGITPVINRLKKLGVNPEDYIPDVVNPITGISPFGEGGAEAAAKTKDEVVKEVKPGTTPTLDPQTAADKANRVLSDPNSSQKDREIAEKVLRSLQNSQ